MKINYSNPKKFAMGLAIGNAIGIPFGGASQSWESYWANQTEVLFFGLYSEISGGQMPNKKTGSSDYLTVAGSAGSETYQCPNTAPYIAADTDYIWFKTDESQRTVTTAELIGYDLQRTPVKYQDASPNEIVAIIILNAAVTGTKRNYLFRDMWLPILWDNDLNGYGHIKDNRIGQQLWTPESVYTVQDTFTGADDVWIQLHRPDIGPLDGELPTTWYYGHAEMTLSGNKLHNNLSTSAGRQAVIESGLTDPDISLDLDIPDSDSYINGIIARWKDNNEFWRVTVRRNSGGTVEIYISKFDTTIHTAVIGSHVAGVGTLRTVWSGNYVTVYWKGIKIVDSYETDGAFNTMTKHGVFLYRDTITPYVEVFADNFIIA